MGMIGGEKSDMENLVQKKKEGNEGKKKETHQNKRQKPENIYGTMLPPGGQTRKQQATIQRKTKVF